MAQEKSDATSKILDLQRDLHVNDLASEKKTPVRFERFSLLFSLRQRESPFTQCQGPRPPTFDTATLCIGVMSVEMRARVTHGTVGRHRMLFGKPDR